MHPHFSWSYSGEKIAYSVHTMVDGVLKVIGKSECTWLLSALTTLMPCYLFDGNVSVWS